MRFNLNKYFKLVDSKFFDYLVMENDISSDDIIFIAYLTNGFKFTFDMFKTDVLRVLKE